MLTLGIETSCDETAVALVEDGKVLSSEVSSSVHLHSEYGGVVPEIASRFHTEYIFSVFRKALEDSKKDLKDVELVAVTKGPGLPGSLLVGISFAKAVSFSMGIPVIGVDHLKAHMVAAFLDEAGREEILRMFPFLGMVVSGGHTSLFHCKSITDIELIGNTLDDAVGEAYDKVAKVLSLGYPGGPVVERRAREYTAADKIDFPRALLRDSAGIDFSFSGLKTAVMYHWQGVWKSELEKDRVCASFQEAVVDVIGRKVTEAIRTTGADKLVAGGGVINNDAIRERLSKCAASSGVRFFMPEKKYCSDNAAMVAALGELSYCAGERSELDFAAEPVSGF